MNIHLKCIVKILKMSWCLLRNKLPAMSLLFNYHCTRAAVSLIRAHSLVSWDHYDNMTTDFLNSIHYLLFCVLQFSDKWQLGLLLISHRWRLKAKKISLLPSFTKNLTLQKYLRRAGREWVYNEQGSIFYDYIYLFIILKRHYMLN